VDADFEGMEARLIPSGFCSARYFVRDLSSELLLPTVALPSQLCQGTTICWVDAGLVLGLHQREPANSHDEPPRLFERPGHLSSVASESAFRVSSSTLAPNVRIVVRASLSPAAPTASESALPSVAHRSSPRAPHRTARHHPQTADPSSRGACAGHGNPTP
jgi:hypothetical protein